MTGGLNFANGAITGAFAAAVAQAATPSSQPPTPTADTNVADQTIYENDPNGQHLYATNDDGQCSCSGTARVLLGNSNHIGKTGGFYPRVIDAESAAVIPDQWGGKNTLRPNAGSISVESNGVKIMGNVGDVVGGTSPDPSVNVRTYLQQTYPGRLILELPGGTRDMGIVPVTVKLPCSMNCPVGTTREQSR